MADEQRWYEGIPDPREGFTAFPNMLLEEVMRHSRPAEWMVLCCIVRRTLGWHKDEDRISVGQIQEMTGIPRRTVFESLNVLERSNLIVRVAQKTEIGGDAPSLFQLNLIAASGAAHAPPSPPPTFAPPSSKNVRNPGAVSAPSPGAPPAPTKERVTERKESSSRAPADLPAGRSSALGATASQPRPRPEMALKFRKASPASGQNRLGRVIDLITEGDAKAGQIVRTTIKAQGGGMDGKAVMESDATTDEIAEAFLACFRGEWKPDSDGWLREHLTIGNVARRVGLYLAWKSAPKQPEKGYGQGKSGAVGFSHEIRDDTRLYSEYLDAKMITEYWDQYEAKHGEAERLREEGEKGREAREIASKGSPFGK